jgi:hypothetical protein
VAAAEAWIDLQRRAEALLDKEVSSPFRCAAMSPRSQGVPEAFVERPFHSYGRAVVAIVSLTPSTELAFRGLYGAIATAGMIAPPAMAQTTTPASNTRSTPGSSAGTSADIYLMTARPA